MPIYSEVNKGLPRSYDMAEEYAAPLWETFKAGVGEGLAAGPLASSSRIMTRDHFSEFPEMTDQEAVDYAKEWGAGPVGMPVAEQEDLIRQAGLSGRAIA